jgi:Ribonuclease G/E
MAFTRWKKLVKNLKARVRGIYATALTKLLLESGFEVVQPSQAIKSRFKIADNNEPPDLKIKDKHDLQGIVVLGKIEAVHRLKTILQDVLEDVITREWNVSVDGIYKGYVVNEDEKNFYVKIGNETVGVLPKNEAPAQGQNDILVQVERKHIGRRTPMLTTQLKIVGDCAILAQNVRVGVSLKIRDIVKRAELYALGRKLAPEGWGIIWREPAAHKPKEVLENEVADLVEKAKLLAEKASSSSAPCLLLEGLRFMSVEFPYMSKKKLDALRASVVPTIEGHHFYKSCGGKVSAALEMAEGLLERGQSPETVRSLFEQQTISDFPEEGMMVEVEHVKLSGAVLHLGQAVLEVLSGSEIRYCRTMKMNGYYDGLGVVKEAGDKAISQTKPGDWHITTNYYSKDGRWKGAYININTPIEIYPKALRYVDLEVDVCVRPNGEIKILDFEKLERALEKGLISQRLYERVKAEVKEVAKNKPTVAEAG